MSETKRLRYIDNIRIFLTGIVIIQHLAITYGAPGGWYYREFALNQLDPISLVILVLFAAANQAYFMGFFFFLSGYFSAGSLNRRGFIAFFKQRVVRLEIPILLFVYLISPVLRLLMKAIFKEQAVTFANLLKFYRSLKFGFEPGPIWFVILLLIFNILHLLGKRVHKQLSLTMPSLAFPTKTQALLYALV